MSEHARSPSHYGTFRLPTVTLAKMLAADRERIRTGVYNTPLEYARLARECIAVRLGDDDGCVVWDASCGSGNLTAGGSFRHLIQSTLDATDVAHGTCCFQHDFLASMSLPDEVTAVPASVARTRTFVFFNNPP